MRSYQSVAGPIDADWVNDYTAKFAHLAGRIGRTNLPDMMSLAAFGQLQNAIERRKWTAPEQCKNMPIWCSHPAVC